MNPVRIVAVGDISFGDNAVSASFGIDSLLRRRPHLDVFAHVKDILAGHDMAFCNLETVLSERGHDPARLRSKHMRGRPHSVKHLVNAGFNVVNIANNHILQHGTGAFEETVDLLRSHNLVVVGLAGRNGWHCEPARVEVHGREFVFLGYAFEKDKYFNGVPLYAQTDLAGITADVRRVKTSDNVVICSFHWGLEFGSYPSLDQITVGRGVIDAGCDLVLGHHPHVLNGFERYNDKYIFYSLGNFVFDQVWNEDCRQTMAVHLQRPTERAFELERIDSVRIGDDYRPAPSCDTRFDEALRRMCSEIQETIGSNGKTYQADVDRKRKRNRYRAWLFLLTNIHRYDPVILRQILGEAVFRRVPRLKGAAAPPRVSPS